MMRRSALIFLVFLANWYALAHAQESAQRKTVVFIGTIRGVYVSALNPSYISVKLVEYPDKEFSTSLLDAG